MIYTLYTFIAVFLALQADRVVGLFLSAWAMRRFRSEREKLVKSQMEQLMLEQSMESLKSGKTVAH